jgi:alkanesulfonate monooxygenase SsuD/methylene tetrahydromethanopterin reductase-like flavin-dependent oxidoreductase (luciferase family)
MRPLKIGLALTIMEDVDSGVAPSWVEIRRRAQWAEDVGFDIVWIPDELLWESESWSGPRGWWEGVAFAAAVAEATSTVAVGTWVLSALHRNAALSANDRVVSRYEEAVKIVVSLLRRGDVAFDGAYHFAELANRPPGPRVGGIPIMLAGHGQRTIGIAAEYGDMWSAFATTSSQPEAFTEMLDTVDAACQDRGRDPSTLGRSIGLSVVPAGFTAPPALGIEHPLTGEPAEIAERIQAFAALGVTNVEFMVWPAEREALEAAAAVLAILDSWPSSTAESPASGPGSGCRAPGAHAFFFRPRFPAVCGPSPLGGVHRYQPRRSFSRPRDAT